MKKSKELHIGKQLLFGVLLATAVWIMVGMMTIISHADGQGKSTGDGVKIREKASTSSEVMGSVNKGDLVTVKGSESGSDGKTWYKIEVNGVSGYIRSDFLSVNDSNSAGTSTGTSTTSSTGTSTTSSSGNTTTVKETPATVTEVSPVSATVTGGQSVNVRSNASTTSNVVQKVESGVAVTVTGTATGSDGKTWYQVKFNVNNADVTGFIRSDYINLSGELKSPGEVAQGNEQQPTQEQTPAETPSPEPAAGGQKYAVSYQNDTWYLVDNEKQGQYKIDDIFSKVDTNAKLYNQAAKTTKILKIVVIILVFIIIGLGTALTFMLFKAREAEEDAYYSEVERVERERRTRSADRPQSRTQRPDSAERNSGNSQGPRTQGQRPQGQRTQGPRPQGQRPQSQRPQGSAQVQPGRQRPVSEGQRPVQENRKPQPQSAQRQNPQTQKQVQKPLTKKPKNFMDDDEFEFGFLNWDGEDED